MLNGDDGEPVEDAMHMGELGQQHHSCEEEIDIRAFSDRVRGEVEGNDAKNYERTGADPDPPSFRDVARAQKHQSDADAGDAPDGDVSWGQTIPQELKAPLYPCSYGILKLYL